MHPVLFQLGPLTLHTYGFMIALGFVVILYLMQRDARRYGLDANAIGEMAFWSLLIGIVATRLLHIIWYPQDYSWSDPIGWIAIWRGGLVFQGAIPAVIIYALIGLRRRGIPFWTVPDVVMPYVPLAQAFGRVGCFFYGCCYGERADALPWAICFPKGSPAYADHTFRFADFDIHTQTLSYPVHPTQLYSVIGLLLVCGLLLLVRKSWRPFLGITLPLYLVFDGIQRFVIEFYRGDHNPVSWSGGLLSNQQIFSLLMVLAGVLLFAYRWKYAPAKEPAPQGPAT